MSERKLRTTLSAAAWCGVFLCGLALLFSASAAAAKITTGSVSSQMAQP